MIKFRHGSTMTVSELIEKLKEYDGDLPVFAGWEGVTAWIHPDCFSLEFVNKDIPGCDALVIDVEEH